MRKLTKEMEKKIYKKEEILRNCAGGKKVEKLFER